MTLDHSELLSVEAIKEMIILPDLEGIDSIDVSFNARNESR